MEENKNDQQNDEVITDEEVSPFRLNIGFPACIMRTLGGDVGQSAQELTSMFMPPVYRPPLTGNKKKECTEKQDTTEDISGGLLNNKDLLHVLEDDTKQNVYTHRLSYNVLTDAYYENGNINEEYIKTWKKGVLQWDNIYYKREHDWNKVYLARDPGEDKNKPGRIYWKFDYRQGNFLISKLSLKVQHTIFDNSASIVWTVTPLSMRTNANPNSQMIEFEPATSYPHNVNSRRDVTSLVEGQYGFVLCASLSGGLNTNISWQRTQLFRMSTERNYSNEFVVDLMEDDFGLDVRVELVPDLICESLPEIKEGKGNELVLNDKETSDFIVRLQIMGDSEGNENASSNKEIRDFYVHCDVLLARSDYFKALFDSHMVESKEKSVTLSGISASSLETILEFTYTGTLPDINSFEEWVELLYGASRLLIPTLVQRCEKGIREYLNDESVEIIEDIANECGADQLLRCCKMLKVEGNQEVVL